MTPISDNDKFVSLHKLATIGMVKSFGQEREWFGYRRDMTPGSLKCLIEDFIEKLQDAQKEMVSLLPKSVIDGFELYKEKKKNGLQDATPDAKEFFTPKYRFLENLMQLPVYSWNGQRYDLPVMLGPLIHGFSKKAGEFKKMNVIKRGTSFMEIKYGKLVFRDFINFSSPMSLGESRL